MNRKSDIFSENVGKLAAHDVEHQDVSITVCRWFIFSSSLTPSQNTCDRFSH